jgi:glyoxylase-like metal-dependent hydrolase (beta-lactamase superfamily II)
VYRGADPSIDAGCAERPANRTLDLDMTIEPFEIYAIRYAHLGGRHPGENFVLADPHEYASDLDYFVWVLRRRDGDFLVDTGFADEAARRRGRELLRSPAEALRLLGMDPGAVTDVILTHLHYDHAGNLDQFPRARFHVQDREVAYATGRYMSHGPLRAAFDLDDILYMVRHVYAGRAVFHDGDVEVIPGLNLHRVGGHSAGLQILRVWTGRGWVVLASDAAHLYAHVRQNRIFPVVYNVGDMLEGYRLLYRLADSPSHIVPGHDPLVMKYYPAARPELEGIIVRLDCAPSEG